MKINALKEGLNKGFYFKQWEDLQPEILKYDRESVKDKELYDELRKLVNAIKSGDDKSRLQYNNIGIKFFDPENLTSNFYSFLISRINKNGWDENDNFLKWLKNTDDMNISALDVSSATALADHFDKKHFKPNDKYLTQKNNLFFGSSKDIIYKLNLLYMLQNKSLIKDYKDNEGNNPSLDLILNGSTFEDIKTIKNIMSRFKSEDDEDDEEDEENANRLIPFGNWAQYIAKWKSKDVLGNLLKLIKISTLNNKEKETLAYFLEQIFKDAKKLELFYKNCKIDGNIDIVDKDVSRVPRDDLENILKCIKKYFKVVQKEFDLSDYAQKSSTNAGGKLLKPGETVKIKKALELTGLTPKSSFKPLGMSLLKMKDKEKGMSYYKAFTKIYSNSKMFADFLNYPIKANSNGALPWNNTIISYIDNINSQDLK